MWFPMCRLRVSPYPETAGGGPSEKRDGTSPVLSQLLPYTCPWPQPLKTLFSCNGQPLGQIQAFEELTPMATLAMEEECGKQEWQLLRQLGLLAGHCPCLDCPPLSFLNIPTWSNPVKHILIFTLVREQQISVHWKQYSTLAKRKHPVILFHPPTHQPPSFRPHCGFCSIPPPLSVSLKPPCLLVDWKSAKAGKSALACLGRQLPLHKYCF